MVYLITQVPVNNKWKNTSMKRTQSRSHNIQNRNEEEGEAEGSHRRSTINCCTEEEEAEQEVEEEQEEEEEERGYMGRAEQGGSMNDRGCNCTA
jgi:hypothetical protein